MYHSPGPNTPTIQQLQDQLLNLDDNNDSQKQLQGIKMDGYFFQDAGSSQVSLRFKINSLKKVVTHHEKNVST